MSMAPPHKYVHNADGRTVDGVSYHQRGGFYIIRAKDQERECFSKGPGALEEAKRRYDELNGARSGKYDHILPVILTALPGLGQRPGSRAFALESQ